MVGVPTPRAQGPAPGMAASWRFEAGEVIVPGRLALRLLGGGNRYEAYVAWDERLHAPVVVKVLRPHLVDDAWARGAIAGEAAALERLQHPILVRSFGAVLDGDRPHLILEYLEGPRLSTLLRRFSARSPSSSWSRWCTGCAQGSRSWPAKAGSISTSSPRNIVMTAMPRLIDLSVARPIAAARHISRPVGTDAYMAPEQCDPARFSEIGPPADIWGLGATLYEALTQRQAFPADDGPPYPQLRGAIPPLPDKVPPALAEAVAACLADDPAARPTAEELDELIEPLAGWSARARRRLR